MIETKSFKETSSQQQKINQTTLFKNVRQKKANVFYSQLLKKNSLRFIQRACVSCLNHLCEMFLVL